MLLCREFIRMVLMLLCTMQADEDESVPVQELLLLPLQQAGAAAAAASRYNLPERILSG